MRASLVYASLLSLAACWGADAYIVEGTVVELPEGPVIVLDHEDVPGVMPAMTMPFRLGKEDLKEGLHRGDRVVARVLRTRAGHVIDKLRTTGRGAVPELAGGVPALRPGDLLPAVTLPVTGGASWVIGEGQAIPTAVAFLFTTCPDPDRCPLLARRLQEIQAAVGTKARIAGITIDPTHDTLEVLGTYAEQVGAKPQTWRFGRLEADALAELALRVSLRVTTEGRVVDHGMRLLVLDADGRLIERYDDNRWPTDRLVQQLTTGGPPAPPGSDGTVYPSE